MRLVLMKSKYLLPLFSRSAGLDLVTDTVVAFRAVSRVVAIGLLSFSRLPLKEINAISLSALLSLLFELDSCSVTNEEALTKLVVVCVGVCSTLTTNTKSTTTATNTHLLAEYNILKGFRFVSFDFILLLFSENLLLGINAFQELKKNFEEFVDNMSYFLI